MPPTTPSKHHNTPTNPAPRFNAYTRYKHLTLGRLTDATIGSNTFTYSYTAPTTAQCSQPSANLTAHKNSNRTSSTITQAGVNGGAPVTTTYCYNTADQLIASSDPTLNSPVYDDHGNTTSLGTTATPITFTYDASDRNTAIVQKTTAGTGFGTYYNRDVQGRIVYREKDTITTWNWTLNQQTWYGFTGSGDTPDFTRDANWNITEKYLQLPGNVLLTIRPAESDTLKQKTYSLVNIHSDVFATANASGTVTGTNFTGPFGEQISGQTAPNNTANGTSYQYVGQNKKLTESGFATSLIQMGARVYVPSLGRFLQVDPVEGGTDNNYVYAADAVNEFDLTGTKTQRGPQSRIGRQLSAQQQRLVLQYGVKGRGPVNPSDKKVWKQALKNMRSQQKDLKIPTEKLRASRLSKDIPKTTKNIIRGEEKTNLMIWLVDTFGPWKYMNLPVNSKNGQRV